MTDAPKISSIATQQEVADIVASFKDGASIEGLMLLDAASKLDVMVADGAEITKPLILGDDLLFVQPDGTIIGLLDGAKANFALSAEDLTISSQNIVAVALQQGAWTTVADAVEVDLQVLSTTVPGRDGGSGEQEQVLAGDPLNGLPISPLLPPTEYQFPELRDREVGADDGGFGEPDVQFGGAGLVSLVETDSGLVMRFSNFVEVIAGGADIGEQITNVTLTLPGLPAGTVANNGSFSSNGATQTFTFNGTFEQYNALEITLPIDFSTESRNDFTPGDLTGTITASSNFLGQASLDFPVTVAEEGDLDFGASVLRAPETDLPVVFRLNDGLTPQSTDADGSESVLSVSVDLSGLPAGARVSTDGGANYTAVSGTYSFSGTLAEYEQIFVELPADYSTTNPGNTITATVQATTDEGGNEIRPMNLIVDATPDIVIALPPTINAIEDGNGADGSGVTIDPTPNAITDRIFVEDIDGSEDATVVEMAFTDLPGGTTFSNGSFDSATAIWTGTMAEANALTLDVPGDYSGTFSSVITATNPEGSETATQTFVVAPAGDVDINVSPIVAAETDAPVVINPSASWTVSVSDTDGSSPPETLQSVSLTLNDLPPGVVVQNAPAGSVTYDPAAGGVFTFSGTPSEYALLRLVFPEDYSTESSPLASGVIEGTISGVSNEGSAGPVNVELRITPEGDVQIDPIVIPTLTEEEFQQSFALGDVLDLKVTDNDGSESLSSVSVEITGLPAIDFTLANVSGFGSSVSLATSPVDGTQTLTAVFDSGNIQAAFDAATISLPIDFSTANRSDLNAGMTQSIAVSATAQTDEGGQATAQSFVNVDFVEDIDLTLALEITAEEDAGVQNSSIGVRVPLNILIDITDNDGSETDVAGSPFSAEVTIEFTDLPSGASLTTGTLIGANWTGTVDDARNLEIDFPGDYAGTTLANVTVTTLEGVESSPTAIVITPTPDINISGEIVATETDSPVSVLFSDFINLTINPANETLSSLVFTLPDLPAGMVALDGAGQPVGTFTPDGSGLFTFVFDSTAEPLVDPADITLTFPTDFSSENPNLPLQAELVVVSIQNGILNAPVTASIDVTIQPEGDVQIDRIGTADFAETDAPIDFKPSDYLDPIATDADGSESVQLVSVTFNALPTGTEFSIDGVNFTAAPFDLNFVGTLAEYDALVIRLPADFSTQSPATTLTGTVIATTDEFGSANETFDVTVSAEGDLQLIGTGTVTLSENDAPGAIDLDGTVQTPQDVRLADVLTASPTDADGSEEISRVIITLADLPVDAQISLDGGATFAPFGTPGSANFEVSSLAEFEAVMLRLPDDFSTQRPEGAITGTLNFITDEANLNSETTPAPGTGNLAQAITIEVTPEADVFIAGVDSVVIEDLGTPIDLGLTAAITDQDGSETLTALSVTFTGLPTNGPVELSDGTLLTATSNVWTGTTLSDLSGLSIVRFPEHFSGVIDLTTTVVTNETGPAGESVSTTVEVTPVAEPEIVLTVAPGAFVTAVGPDAFSVKEDAGEDTNRTSDDGFLLQIDATTPDQDGSEALQQIVIENVPAGWLTAGDGAVDASRFASGGGDVASADVVGTTLTITLNPNVVAFNAQLQMIPLSDQDEDVETLTGGDLLATVTSIDTAAGLPSDTATARDGVDVNLDAVVDEINLQTRNRNTNENLGNRRVVDAGITRLELQDTDGSESFTAVIFTVTVDTLSDTFDPASLSDLVLNFRGRDSFVDVARTDPVPGDNEISIALTRPAGVSDADFASAITGLRYSVPQKFSGVLTTQGEVFWKETETGDEEIDFVDNFGSAAFSTVVTVRPVTEATLDAGVFVVDTDFVVAAGTDEVGAVATRANPTVEDTTTLTLIESTNDSTGEGQVQAFLRLSALTPDTDGSEELTEIVVSNIPSSWIGVAETTQNVTLNQSMFFNITGTGAIAQAEFDKIDTATYNANTGELTIVFLPDVTDFAGSVAVYPALYEDYDVDRANGDPFTDDGNFFGADLNFALTTRDGNTVTTSDLNVDVTVDVDVDPVNNEAFVLAFPRGNEAVIDAAGGTFDFSFIPFIEDMDGSETIISAVLRNIPNFLTVYVTDPANPSGPKIPALLTEINGDGTLDWSLNEDQWQGVELRGVPKHFSGDIPIAVDIVTLEANGSTGVTNLSTATISIDPVADGGNPSETFRTLEDQAVRVVLDGNIIDQTPESPEIIEDAYTIFNVQADSEGRLPLFFDGLPNQTGTTPAGDPIYSNLISPDASGTYNITAAQSPNLHVLPGQDSNEAVVFQVEVTYVESSVLPGTPGPAETTTGIGTVTINVEGVADTPDVDVQDADPAATPGGIDKTTINAIYDPSGTTDGVPNQDLAYAYAGFDDTPFQLIERLSDDALQLGFNDPAVTNTFEAADPLTGARDEILFTDGDPDGSETLYYIITDIPPEIRFVGGTPIDASGETYLVTAAELATVTVVPNVAVSDPSYFNLTLNAIVTENDVDLSSVRQIGPGVDVQDVLNDIDGLTGGSVTSSDFSIIVLPSGNAVGGGSCPPGDPRQLPIPELTFVGDAFEDTGNELKIQLTEVPGQWESIDDLSGQPLGVDSLGVSGDFGVGLTLPPGATLTSSTPGAVLFDPITGQYTIDFAALGTDSSNPLLTAGTVTYTPPPQESSPSNPFPVGDTFGTADPYDSLPDIQTTSVLNNFTCNSFSSQPGTMPVFVQPVVDGPTIAIGAPASALEDTAFSADITLSSADEGERATGDVVITLGGDPDARLFDANGELTPDAGTGPGTGNPPTFTLSPNAVGTLEVRAAEHFSGPLEITVTASSEDIDGSVASNTTTQTIDIIPVADAPEFVYNPDQTATETGLPLVTDPTGTTPIVTIVEDKPISFGEIFQTAQSPDQDGSETASAVIGPLPDYVILSGASGIIDNGDDTFTVPVSQLNALTISLVDEHARTPDSEDATILPEIPVSITINTLELANSDQNQGTTDFILRVLPDADKPTVQASISPTGGAEDDGTQYDITLSATSPDVHETISFEVTLPAGSELFVGGTPVTVPASGIVVIPGIPDPSFSGPGIGFIPAGQVSFVPPADFAGDVSIDVVAITTDESTTYSYTDTELSDVANLNLAITATPDLTVTVTDPVVTLPETDAQVTFTPSSNVALDVTDTDGSESIDSVTFEMSGVPAGTTYSVGAGDIAASGTLVFTGTEAEFNALVITFPTDFATNGTPLTSTVTATTNEGGNVSESFDLDITGELDINVSVTNTDLAQQEGVDLLVALGIDAQITDIQSTPSETLETVVVTFDQPLPAGTLASDGALSATRSTLTFARGALSPADFALAIAALSLTVPASFAGDITGTVSVTTNHGTAPDVPLAININARPDIVAPVDVTPTFDQSQVVTFADLLANATDTSAMTVENITSPDPLVQISVVGTDVTITVPPGYLGTPVLEYEVVDSAPVPARSSATANLDIDTLQMQDSGSVVTGPDGVVRSLMTDVTGDATLGGTVAKGTNTDDAVDWLATQREYAGITEFQLMGGSDFIDLSGAAGGFTIDGGAGNDILQGSDGRDTLLGGAGDDIFVLASGPVTIADEIGDYGAGDQIDLSEVVNGVNSVGGRVSYDNTTGVLQVDGSNAFEVASTGGGIPAQVEVIFEDSAGAAQTAIV